MSLIDKFLNAIKLNDDEYDEEEFLDDDFDDIEALIRFIQTGKR